MSLFGPPNIEKLQARRNVQGLIKALGYQKDAKIRAAAARALGELSDACAVEPLITALEDDHGWVRSAAARALGELGDARAVELLLAVLKDEDEHEYVCRAAAEALGKLGDARAVEPLIAALWLWDASKAAAIALEQLGWQPGQDESAVRYWLAKQEWGNCAALGTVAVETLIALLKKSAEYGAFAQSMLSLERFGHLDMGVIGGMRGAACVEMREAAAKVLAKIGAPAVPPLITALQDRSAWTCMTIAWALGELKDARAVEPLITMLKDRDSLRSGDCLCDCPPQVAIEALVKIGAPSIEPLTAVLEDEDREIRQAAAKALETLGWKPG